MSLRARLSLLVVAAVALGLVVVTVAANTIVSRQIRGSIDDGLANRARVVAASLPEANPELTCIPSGTLADATSFVQVVRLDGTIFLVTCNLAGEELPVEPAILDELRLHHTHYLTAHVGGLELRMIVAPLFNSRTGDLVGGVEVARPVAESSGALHTVRLTLLIGDLIALVLAGGLALFLTRRSLRPLGRIQRSAEEVAATGDPRRRMPAQASGRGDEVARLAASFDRMLERLEASRAQLGATLESQRRFLADASHELRTPLTSARGNLEVILRNPDMDPAERAAAITDATLELERMGRLVDGLLTLTRAEAGGLAAPEQVSLSEVVERAHRSALARGSDRRLSLRNDLDGAEVTGSADVLRRLFDNLYDNAIKYTTPGGHVDVVAAAHDGWATVTVTDDGPGIEAAELPRIFERFYRAPGARSAEGSGLGLAIVHLAATVHGGSVGVSSMPGQGATFVVTLPVSVGQSAKLTTPTPLEEQPLRTATAPPPSERGED